MSDYYVQQFTATSHTRNKCLNTRCKAIQKERGAPRRQFENYMSSCPNCGSTQFEPLQHTLSLRDDGVIECTCESWIFGHKHHPKGWSCKHGDEIRAMYDIDAILRGVKPKAEKHRGSDFDVVAIDGRMAGFIDSLDCPAVPEVQVQVKNCMVIKCRCTVCDVAWEDNADPKADFYGVFQQILSSHKKNSPGCSGDRYTIKVVQQAEQTIP